ncbi:MAG: phage holin family protein [Tannerella sp.]|jgi:hypothetical protein|nr:phage holin family protein [Tannerella sp.]
MKKDAEQVFRDLKEDVTKYVELRFELLKLNIYEQASKIIAFLSYGLLLSAVTLIFVLFIHLVFGFFLSKWFGSFTLGFGIILILYAIQVVIIILNRERIQRSVMNKIIQAFNYYEEKAEEAISEKENDEPKK